VYEYERAISVLSTKMWPVFSSEWQWSRQKLGWVGIWHWFSLMGTFLPFEIITYAI
jgi:hypothetical protein